MFQLTWTEAAQVASQMSGLAAKDEHVRRSSRSQSATLKRGRNVKYRPLVFTEHGALMAASILNSPRAVEMAVFVVRAFVRLVKVTP